MTDTIQNGDYIELPNREGKPIVRLVYVGDNCLLEHRQYRNIWTNEISDWRPVDNARPKAMNDKQRAEFIARKIGA